MSAAALPFADAPGRSDNRSVRTGVVVAAIVHAGLLYLLSRAGPPQQPPAPPAEAPLEVSLVTAVAPEAQSPTAEPPAPSIAPETGAPADAAPPPAPTPQPAPAKPAPRQPAPPQPAAAKPEPAKPAPPQPKPAPAAPAPKPAPVKPVPTKPAPVAKPAPVKPQAAAAKPAPSRPAPVKPGPVKPTTRLAGLSSSLAAGSSPAATAARPRGARLGGDFLAGLSADAPARKPTAAAPGTKVGPYPTASIVGAIARQIQPCADRQVNPGPGANRIVTTLNIRLNQDGTLAATPTKVRQAGVDDENGRYAQRVVDLGVAAFKGCTPLRLPTEYYSTANGGWSNINYRWQLR